MEKMIKVILLVCFLGMIGCATNRVNLLESGQLMVQDDLPPNYWIKTHAFEKKGALIIFGKFDRVGGAGPIGGHLHISVKEPLGDVFVTLIAHLKKLPPHKREGSHPASFYIQVPGVPVKGSIVNITFDQDKHE